MKRFFSSFLVLISLIVLGQMYQPIDTADYTERQAFIDKFKQRNDAIGNTLKSEHSGKLGRELKNNLSDFSDYFAEEIADKNFIFHAPLQAYFEGILNEITTANSINQESFNLLISKDNSVNAYCLADGTLVMNLGLLYWLENENQLAGILSHEMAHFLLKHPTASQVAMIQDEIEGKKTLQQVRTQKHNQQDKAFALFKEKIYAQGEESRKQEKQADSLGLVLLEKTRYNTHDFLSALELMIVYDTIKPNGLAPETYKKYFDLPDFPFKDEWLNKEDFSTYDYSQYQEKLDLDSIASHPEAKDRLGYLQSIFPTIKRDTIASQASPSFKKWNEIAAMERIPTYYYTEKYGLALYHCLFRLQRNENEEFYKHWLGKILEKFYESRKNYTLNRYMDRIEPEGQTESYQQFINFIWNMNLVDIERFRDHYAQF